jgi:glutamate carboxypeptidase
MNADETGGEATGKSNVIPPRAIAVGDLRTSTNEQIARVEGKCARSARSICPGRT